MESTINQLANWNEWSSLAAIYPQDAKRNRHCIVCGMFTKDGNVCCSRLCSSLAHLYKGKPGEIEDKHDTPFNDAQVALWQLKESMNAGRCSPIRRRSLAATEPEYAAKGVAV